jgi:hypothetical protein
MVGLQSSSLPAAQIHHRLRPAKGCRRNLRCHRHKAVYWAAQKTKSSLQLIGEQPFWPQPIDLHHLLTSYIQGTIRRTSDG